MDPFMVACDVFIAGVITGGTAILLLFCLCVDRLPNEERQFLCRRIEYIEAERDNAVKYAMELREELHDDGEDWKLR